MCTFVCQSPITITVLEALELITFNYNYKDNEPRPASVTRPWRVPAFPGCLTLTSRQCNGMHRHKM